MDTEGGERLSWHSPGSVSKMAPVCRYERGPRGPSDLRSMYSVGAWSTTPLVATVARSKSTVSIHVPPFKFSAMSGERGAGASKRDTVYAILHSDINTPVRAQWPIPSFGNACVSFVPCAERGH